MGEARWRGNLHGVVAMARRSRSWPSLHGAVVLQEWGCADRERGGAAGLAGPMADKRYTAAV
jgi:hypothetical protein